MKSNSSSKAWSGRFGILAILMIAGGLPLAACSEDPSASTRAYQPLSSDLLALMQEKGTSQNAPILIRTYKKEAEFEIWKMAADGRYVKLKTYPMCRWSGQLGPKKHEGDRQVPEGFYAITPAQMNPHSAYYLSFNVGYPNAYDRAHGYDGGSIMVHGACSSAGCFSMTDQQIAEIYSLAREAFLGGQHAIQMQSFPFQMTAENLAKYRLDPNIEFWKELKVGADNFEVTRQDVVVGVCSGRYVFNARPANGGQFDPGGPCPALKEDEAVRAAVAAKERQDETKVAQLIAQGVHPVRTVYADGGQNPSFAAHYIPGVSRPDALAQGPVDMPIEDIAQDAKAKKQPGPTKLAAAALAKEAGKDKSKMKQPPQAAPAPVVAEAPPQQPQQAEQPKNAVSLLASLWNGGQKNTPPAQQPGDPAPAAAAAVAPQPANVPLPPSRLQAVAMKPSTSADQQ